MPARQRSESGTWQVPLANQKSVVQPVPGQGSLHDTSRGSYDKIRRPLRCPSRQRPKKESGNTRNTARAATLRQRLIGPNPTQSFAANCRETIADWVALLGETTSISEVASSDPRIIAAFKAVDKIILENEATHLLRRLAYVQLIRIFTTLEAILRSEREQSQANPQPHQTNATAAIDIYMMAQVSKIPRRVIHERKRRGRAWSCLAGPSPLLTMMYSEAADTIVRDLWRQDSASLKSMATGILQHSTWTIRVCTRLTHIAEWAVASGCPSNIQEIVAAEIKQLLSQTAGNQEAHEISDTGGTGNTISGTFGTTIPPHTQNSSLINAEGHRAYFFEPSPERDDDALYFGLSRQPLGHMPLTFGQTAAKLHFSFASYATAAVPHGTNGESCSQSISDRRVLPETCSCGPRQNGEKQKTITKFIQTHLPAFNLGMNAGRDSTSPQGEHFKYVLIDQVRVWVTAREHAACSLMELACENLVWELVYWIMLEETFVSIFGDLVRYVYSHCIVGDVRLCHILAQFAACVVEDVCLLEGWHELITEVPSFAKDLVYKLADRCACPSDQQN